MTYLGTYCLGDRLPLALLATSTARVPVWPDAAPIASIYTAAGTFVMQQALPPVDRSRLTGAFLHGLHLDGRFSAGQYAVSVSYKVSGAARAALLRFAVAPSGSADGAVIALHHAERPHGTFLVQELDSRKLVAGRNPAV